MTQGGGAQISGPISRVLDAGAPDHEKSPGDAAIQGPGSPECENANTSGYHQRTPRLGSPLLWRWRMEAICESLGDWSFQTYQEEAVGCVDRTRVLLPKP